MFPRERKKELLILLRSCDLHAVKRLDEIYLKNGFEDFYYARIREKAHFALMGCESICDSGFCISMGTNKSDNYDLYIKTAKEEVQFDVKWEALLADFTDCQLIPVEPAYVRENKEKVTLPKKLYRHDHAFVDKYISPDAPGRKEHIGYIIDRVGFEEYKKWALKDVELLPETIVKECVYWSGIHFDR